MLQELAYHQKSILREYIAYLKKHSHYIKILLIFVSFAIPFILLYNLDAYSFNETWKGRTFYLFFIWLFVLEIVLNWEKYKFQTTCKLDSNVRFFAFAIALLLPTAYVIVANFFGLNEVILDFSRQFNVGILDSTWMPLATEYLVFTVFFVVIILLAYGINGLSDFSLSTLVLGAIGMVYMIDNIWPYGFFTPFQIFVLPTAILATNVLNFMGYITFLNVTNTPDFGELPVLTVLGQGRIASHGIAWPCSGVQSLLIYTLTILLFLKKTNISWKQRVIYFVVGAFVTYFINILRIVSIFVIELNGGDWMLFHNYYGELYAMTWIIAYPLIIIGSRIFWAKMKLRLGNNDILRKVFHQPISVQGS